MDKKFIVIASAIALLSGSSGAKAGTLPPVPLAPGQSEATMGAAYTTLAQYLALEDLAVKRGADTTTLIPQSNLLTDAGVNFVTVFLRSRAQTDESLKADLEKINPEQAGHAISALDANQRVTYALSVTDADRVAQQLRADGAEVEVK